jgi:hypothetical protein
MMMLASTMLLTFIYQRALIITAPLFGEEVILSKGDAVFYI